VCVEREGYEDETSEYSIVTTASERPDAMVRRVLSNELTSGEEGFGSEARPAPSVTYEVCPWLPMMSDHPAVGRGGGMTSIEVKREP